MTPAPTPREETARATPAARLCAKTATTIWSVDIKSSQTAALTWSLIFTAAFKTDFCLVFSEKWHSVS